MRTARAIAHRIHNGHCRHMDRAVFVINKHSIFALMYMQMCEIAWVVNGFTSTDFISRCSSGVAVSDTA